PAGSPRPRRGGVTWRDSGDEGRMLLPITETSRRRPATARKCQKMRPRRRETDETACSIQHRGPIAAAPEADRHGRSDSTTRSPPRQILKPRPLEGLPMLQIDGPRAQDFVDLLVRYTGLNLSLQGNQLRLGVPVPPTPYNENPPSQVLADLVRRLVAPGAVVRVHAFRDAPAAGLIDGFFGFDDEGGPQIMPHHAPRSVFVG